MDLLNGKLPNGRTIRTDAGFRHRRKYENKNLLHRLTLDRFFRQIGEEINALTPSVTLDFGSGEGYFLQALEKRRVDLGSVVGIDIRADAVEEARRRCPMHRFQQVDLLEWTLPERSFDLVIASQVLEHLPEPLIYLKRLCALSRGFLLLTVPCEPWFRLLNLLRGRDLACLGNHPEHVNLWRFQRFVQFVGEVAQVKKAYTVMPFTIVLAKPNE